MKNKRLVAIIVSVVLLSVFFNTYAIDIEDVVEDTSEIETSTQLENSEYAENEILIKYKPEITEFNTYKYNEECNEPMVAEIPKQTEESANQEIVVSVQEAIPEVRNIDVVDTLKENEDGSSIKLLTVETDDIKEAVEEIKQLPNVEYAEPNYKVKIENTDYYFENQWGLSNPDGYDIDIEKVWENVYENDTELINEVIVAVLDTGVDIYHPDLIDNIYVNSDELYGEQGVDNDGNGFIDDVSGWNFVSDSNKVYEDILDSTGVDEDRHGTHVAGIIAAAKNGFGIQGVAYQNVKILPVKFIAGNDGGYLSDEILAIKYAEQMGASIANCSFSSVGVSEIERDVIENSNMLFVCAAGNDSLPLSISMNVPASYHHLDNVLSVASLNNDAQLSYYSNFDENTLAAPGENIWSTLPGGQYGSMSGTSMAAPYVTGSAALLMLENKNINMQQLKEALKYSDMSNSDEIYCFGKLNIAKAYEDYGVNTENSFNGFKQYGGKVFPTYENLYAIGGINENGLIKEIYKYNTLNNSWTSEYNLGFGLLFPSVQNFMYNREIIVTGGKNHEQYNMDSFYYYTISKIMSNMYEKYDPIKGASTIGYEKRNNYIPYREEHNFIFGGSNDIGYSDIIYERTIEYESGYWFHDLNKIEQTMPEPRGYACAEYIDGNVYIFGGSNSTGCLTTTYKFDVDKRTWTQCASTAYPHNNASSIVKDGKIYIFGGTNQFTEDGHDPITENNGIIIDTPSNIVEVYDPATDTWTRIADMVTARSGFSAVEFRNKIMLIGGWNGSYLDEVEYYWGIDAPNGIKVSSNNDNTKHVITWASMGKNMQYDIQFDNSDNIVTVDEPSYTRYVSTGDQHKFRVRARKNGQVSLWSEYHNVMPTGENIKNAKTLNLNTPIQDTLISRNQSNWYKLEFKDFDNLEIRLENIPSGYDYNIQLYDSYGFLITTGNKQDNYSQISNVPWKSGTYYIHVYTLDDYMPDAAYTLIADGEESTNITGRLSSNLLSVTNAAVENNNYMMDPGQYVPGGPSIELQEVNSSEIGLDNTTKVYEEEGYITEDNRYFDFHIDSVPSGAHVMVTLIQPSVINKYNVFFTDTSVKHEGMGCIDGFNNAQNISSCAIKTKRQGRCNFRVNGWKGSTNENKKFKVRAYVSTNPDMFEANQWQSDALNNSKRLNIGTKNQEISAVNASFDSYADIDTYPITANVGDKITVEMELLDGVKSDDYNIGFQTNYKLEEIGINPDGLSIDGVSSYNRSDCTNTKTIKSNPNTCFASWIVPEDSTPQCYIVVQRKNKSAEMGTPVDYKITVTKVTRSEMDSCDDNEYGYYQNDFIEIGRDSTAAEIEKGIGEGSIDNQLDVDWFSYTAPKTGEVTISMQGNVSLALYNGNRIEEIDGKTIKYDVIEGYKYYIAAYVKDGQYAAVKNDSGYTIRVDEKKESNELLFANNSNRRTYYIYSSNPENIESRYLAENGNMLDNYDNLQYGTYTYMAWYHNGTSYDGDSSSIYTDVLFTGLENSQIRINKLGVQVFPERGSQQWTGLQAYSNFIGSKIDNSLQPNNNHPIFYPTDLNLPKIYPATDNEKSKWLSDIYEDVYGDKYPFMQSYNTPIYIMMEFEVLEGSPNISTLAYKTTSANNKNNFLLSNAPYVQDIEIPHPENYAPTYKGMVYNAPVTEANITYQITNDNNSQYCIPVVVNNAFGKKETDTWVTNLNPQNDNSVYLTTTETDMFEYNYWDGEEWCFNTERTSLARKPVGYPDVGFTPNDLLPERSLPPWKTIQTGYYSGLTKQQISASMGNYGVEVKYNVIIENLTDSKWNFNYMTLSGSGTVIGISDNGDAMEYTASGSFGKNDDGIDRYVGRTVVIPGNTTKEITVSVILTTADPGGIANRFVLNKVF